MESFEGNLGGKRGCASSSALPQLWSCSGWERSNWLAHPHPSCAPHTCMPAQQTSSRGRMELMGSHPRPQRVLAGCGWQPGHTRALRSEEQERQVEVTTCGRRRQLSGRDRSSVPSAGGLQSDLEQFSCGEQPAGHHVCSQQ